MEFCSKYGYDYGFKGSDSEEISDEEGDTQVKTKRRFRRADPNIIAVKFDTLVKPNQMQAGEPIVCKSCEAFMSMKSSANITNSIWTCEFCAEPNPVPFYDANQLPKQEDITYLLEAAAPKPEATAAETAEKLAAVKSTDNNYLTFCTDISGSMDTMLKSSSSDTVPMTRLDATKAACVETLKRLEVEEPNKRVSLVTFSEQVKFYGDCKKTKAIETIRSGGSGNYRHRNTPHQINQQMQTRSQPKGVIQKVANMFSLRTPQKVLSHRQKASVPQQQQQQQVSGSESSESEAEEEEQEYQVDVMNNKEKMMTLGANQTDNLRGICKSIDDISNHIKKLRTEGSTALGPALVFSIGFASKKSGSQIILCTDGCANVGMGNLSSYNQSQQGQAEQFYEELAEDAREKGVTVNVISMEGTDCKLALLGKVADKTNGSLNIVNPMNLSDEFKSILENRTIATNVKAKLIVNKKYLYIRDEELEIAESKAIEADDMAKKEELNSVKKSVIVKEIGNANVDTEITFEYGVRKLTDADKEERLKEMPFQLQISYTAEDGTKAVRVYTKVQQFTSDRQLVEDNLVEEDILWTNAAQKMSTHFMSSNNVVAKYKGRQIKNYREKNARLQAAPAQFMQQAGVIERSSKTRALNSLGDIEARDMYSAKKMNRNRMGKK